MNNDRELLELAAKAAGMNHLKPQINFDAEQVFGCWWDRNAEKEVWWNPLTDDGDALRLAVKLNLMIGVYDNYTESHQLGRFNYPLVSTEWNSSNNNDPYAATRRAIVRAAAEIGKEMK